MRHLTCGLLAAALFLSTSAAWAAEPPKGHLVVVGGGTTDAAITQRTLALAGGLTAKVVILPQASDLKDSGEKSAAMWRGLGVAQVIIGVPLDAAAKHKISEATLIWMPGGDQKKLLKAIEEAGAADLIRARYQAGAVVGGTSAGAAVMSQWMMTGEADLKVVVPEGSLVAGLGLWPEAIVDQHFLQRQRFNRLLSAVMQHPDKLGVGIDESTAVIVSPSGWEVIGRSQVLILDARQGKVTPAAGETKAGVQDVRLHLLPAGMKWRP